MHLLNTMHIKIKYTVTHLYFLLWTFFALISKSETQHKKNTKRCHQNFVPRPKTKHNESISPPTSIGIGHPKGHDQVFHCHLGAIQMPQLKFTTQITTLFWALKSDIFQSIWNDLFRPLFVSVNLKSNMFQILVQIILDLDELKHFEA